MEKTLNKFRKSENFPVASLLLPQAVRKPILSLYNFARYADEIADSQFLEPEEKLIKLEQLYNEIGRASCRERV